MALTQFGRESDLRGMLKAGKDESFSPDFLAMKDIPPFTIHLWLSIVVPIDVLTAFRQQGRRVFSPTRRLSGQAIKTID